MYTQTKPRSLHTTRRRRLIMDTEAPSISLARTDRYQKEVERKRRSAIAEGIDLLVAQLNIPDLEKQGKGVQLRRAVEYVADLDERLMGNEKDLDELRKEKQDLEVSLACVYPLSDLAILTCITFGIMHVVSHTTSS